MTGRQLDGGRLQALAILMSDISDRLDRGESVPCVNPNRGHLWLSDDPELIEAAAHGCRTCPVLADCRQYVEQHPEPAGVWAGQHSRLPSMSLGDHREGPR